MVDYGDVVKNSNTVFLGLRDISEHSRFTPSKQGVNTVELPKERTAIAALASIMSIRMLGLFMILPVFSVYATQLTGATATLIGITLGIYGLTQAIFQIPFGILSDYIGRKPVIFCGLLILIIGSVICALSHSIYIVMIGRALQGAGAIGSTVLALVADLTRDTSRGKAMAFIGLAIGFSFTVAMIAGPVLNHWFHLSGIFWVTALLALMGILLLTIVPTPLKPLKTSEKIGAKFSSLLRNTQILRLNYGIFSLHIILTALFIAIPILLSREMGLSESHQIILYVLVLILSFMAALPLIMVAERKRQLKPIFVSAVVLIAIAQLSLCFLHHLIAITAFLLFVFFTAFTVLEALLPSLISKVAPVQNKGAAMGLYSSSQFFGIFAGGSIGGWVFSHWQLTGVFAFCAAIAVLWCIIAIFTRTPQYLSTLVFPLQWDEKYYQALSQLPGVAEVATVSSENLVYVKIDKKKISEPELRKAINGGNLLAV